MKFEDDLRSQMNQREIEPSGDAWDRLKDRLDEDNEVVVFSGRRRRFYAIAAVIAGLALALTFIFNRNDQGAIEPIIVDDSNEIVPLNNSQVQDAVELAEQSETEQQTEDSQKNNDQLVTPVVKKDSESKNIKINKVTDKPSTELAVELEVNKESIPKPEELINPKVDLETQKLNAIVAKVAEIKADKGSVSDEELEALLAQAEKELGLNKPKLNSLPDDISATALLESVEDELEQSFRERVFKALQSGYENVKTAVAERNN